MKNDRWTVGVDPGLTETGMVLLDPSQMYRAGATFTAPRHLSSDLERIVNLGASVTGMLAAWTVKYGFQRVLLGMEYPIVKSGNVATYRKQVSLLHEIESRLWDQWILSHKTYGKDATLVRIAEINPSVSKRILTGDYQADKSAMIAAGPFEGRDDIPLLTREALADAYGHAMAALDIAEVEQLLMLEELVRKPYQPKFSEEAE
jgi:hypothetical protein